MMMMMMWRDEGMGEYFENSTSNRTPSNSTFEIVDIGSGFVHIKRTNHNQTTKQFNNSTLRQHNMKKKITTTEWERRMKRDIDTVVRMWSHEQEQEFLWQYIPKQRRCCISTVQRLEWWELLLQWFLNHTNDQKHNSITSHNHTITHSLSHTKHSTKSTQTHFGYFWFLHTLRCYREKKSTFDKTENLFVMFWSLFFFDKIDFVL